MPLSVLLHLCCAVCASGAVVSSGAVSATAGARTAPASSAPAPGDFWPGSWAAGSIKGGTVPCVGPKRGMLTGYNTQLAVGPGGLVIGPTAGVGLRPRPTSSHTAGVESIARRQAVLQVRGLMQSLSCRLRPQEYPAGSRHIPNASCQNEVLHASRAEPACSWCIASSIAHWNVCFALVFCPQDQYSSLAESMARDPSSVEAADRQQMERLATTLNRSDAGLAGRQHAVDHADEYMRIVDEDQIAINAICPVPLMHVCSPVIPMLCLFAPAGSTFSWAMMCAAALLC